MLRYPERNAEVYFEGTFVNARNGSMIEFMGSSGTLYVDRGRYEIHPERNKSLPASEWVLGSGPRGADFYEQPNGELLHLANWIECIRSRQKPNAPAEAGVGAAAAAHLGNRALSRRPSGPLAQRVRPLARDGSATDVAHSAVNRPIVDRPICPRLAANTAF